MTYLVVIVPPEDVNGGPSPVPGLIEAIEKAMADHGTSVQIEVVI